ncbi:L-histidine N(alpha)-methyltransferase [Actinomadura sp. LD22]|uniref:Histidine N-alpha-methyltransferase n=1 Tax=Actinomadura physcomitrii TaxID=2650748 RepID=A0A6I4MJU7_9ACTN|nr:L-histidine N(alpha)-methyltransferase [Actinomadura physcomitrii]MWA06142.1 L-histidine N(alpha)-methyltransferase [Actinomadura physcomitrii]
MDRFLTADDLAKTLRRDVREGLAGTPKTLPPKWFYDERGSALFEEITKLEEYYPTRREREILTARAPEIAAVTGARTLLELGAGSGEKTRLLLGALAGTLRAYVPVDVSGDFLEEAAAGIAADHPGLTIRTVVADYEQHLHLLPAGERRLIAFLGGTIGNMPPAARIGFLGGLRATMDDGDFLLLGADLVKDPGRLVRAYDDAAGVTAEFNKNVLSVINRELDADFDPDAFEHVAVWDGAEEWIEMRLRSTRDQDVRVGGLDLDVRFAAAEEMRTEISAKFRRERLESELRAAGLELAEFWTDEAGDFSLTLARP